MQEGTMSEDLHALAKKKAKQYRKPGAAGFLAFCEECIRIPGGDTDTGMGTVRFKLWPEQKRVAESLALERLLILLKARQVGMTYIVLAFFLFRSLFWESQEFLIVSLNEKEAKKSLDRIKAMIAALPEWCKPELEISNTTTIKIAESQSIIEVQASTENAGRGRTPTGMLLDEDAYQIYGEKIVTSALPGMEKRKGWMIRLSTGNGVGNAFERTWNEAMQGRGGFKPIFLSWKADPDRNQKWYDAEYEKHGREYMQQEFPNNPVEAFLASGRPFFEMNRVTQDLASHLPVPRYGYLDEKEFVPQINGVIKLWEPPERGFKYVIGADVAEGIEKGDWSTAIVVKVGAVPRQECARLRVKCDTTELADYLALLGMWYTYVPLGNYDQETSPALLAIEANKDGAATIVELMARGYPRLFYMRDIITNTVFDRPGWLTTAQSRRLATRAFQANYRTGASKVLDRDCLEEMAQFFHRGKSGKAEAGPSSNDDLVMARSITEIVANYESDPTSVLTMADADPTQVHGDMRFWVQRDLARALEKTKEMNRGVQELGG